MKTRHLDLGCGAIPRNPYGREEVHAVDLLQSDDSASDVFLTANLAIDPIPCQSDYYDSVSAYDFLEHIPRILPTRDGLSTRFPFIELMNEVHRVLQPDGLFYASTPCFPHDVAFGDPTHVNYLGVGSHAYFSQPLLFARIYGFNGAFEALRVLKVQPGQVYVPTKRTFAQRLIGRMKRSGWITSRNDTHLIWEFRAKK